MLFLPSKLEGLTGMLWMRVRRLEELKTILVNKVRAKRVRVSVKICELRP